MFWLTGIIGVVSIFAPYILGYEANTAELWTTLIFGIALGVISFLEGYEEDKGQWEYWTAIVLGIAAVVTPLVFGFGVAASWTLVIAGTITAVASAAKLFVGQSGHRLSY